MFHNGRTNFPDASYYNSELLKWRQVEDLKWSNLKLAGMSELSSTWIKAVIEGKCKRLDTLYSAAKAMNLKWEYVFKLDLPKSQFRRAVVEAER